jgi:hypothetical protein
MNVVDDQLTVNGVIEVSPAVNDLAGAIRSALRKTKTLTITALANRWPKHFRRGALQPWEIVDANGLHRWVGLSKTGVAALDAVNDEPLH